MRLARVGFREVRVYVPDRMIEQVGIRDIGFLVWSTREVPRNFLLPSSLHPLRGGDIEGVEGDLIWDEGIWG